MEQLHGGQAVMYRDVLMSRSWLEMACVCCWFGDAGFFKGVVRAQVVEICGIHAEFTDKMECLDQIKSLQHTIMIGSCSKLQMQLQCLWP